MRIFLRDSQDEPNKVSRIDLRKASLVSKRSTDDVSAAVQALMKQPWSEDALELRFIEKYDMFDYICCPADTVSRSSGSFWFDDPETIRPASSGDGWMPG